MLSLPRERASAGVLGYRAGRGERICRGVAPTPHKKGPDQRGLAGLVRYVVKEGCWALPKMVRRAFGHAPGWPFALQQSPPGDPSAMAVTQPPHQRDKFAAPNARVMMPSTSPTRSALA
jgi:hypothetical protein